MDETTLGERLKLLDTDFDPIPTQLLRKVIIFKIKFQKLYFFIICSISPMLSLAVIQL
jgi:hypothetical protein